METRQSVEQLAAGLEELTRQLNSFKPTSVDVVGNLEKDLSTEVAQKLLASEQRMDLPSKLLEEQKKSVSDSADLLKGLLIGIESLGENMKHIQKEMDYWRNSEVMEAEEELERLHDKVPLSVPASKGPESGNVSLPVDSSPSLAQ